MGFCLFEDAENPNKYLAINSLHISDLKEIAQGVVRVHFSLENTGSEDIPYIDILADPGRVEDLITDAAKVGVHKSHLHIFAKLSAKPTPLLINNPSRVYLVREVNPEDFFQENSSFLTASTLFFAGEKNRYISERPARFIQLTNANGQILSLLPEADI